MECFIDAQWQEERNIGTSLLLAGLKQENSVGFSARLLGCALIGVFCRHHTNRTTDELNDHLNLYFRWCVFVSAGKVELSRGIHSVFHQMPLIWTPGYLGRALVVMETVCSDITDVKLSKEVVSIYKDNNVKWFLDDISLARGTSHTNYAFDFMNFGKFKTHQSQSRRSNHTCLSVSVCSSWSVSSFFCVCSVNITCVTLKY